jgi:ATP-dependent Clp protease ATP-binding subunit ClpB
MKNIFLPLYLIIASSLFAGTGVKKQPPDHHTLVKNIPKVETWLAKNVLGQPEATKIVADALYLYAAGIHEENRPLATMMFCGASGVGKTEMAKQLTKVLYNDPRRLLRVNMAEYSQEYAMSRLIGSPPGYVECQRGGQLTNQLKKFPYCVLLIDEIEKAHSKVRKLFLQLLDEGYITSAQGEVIDGRHAIIIMTSNIASQQISKLWEEGKEQSEILTEVQPYMMRVLSPELFNRMETVIFRNLSEEAKKEIVYKMLRELKQRVEVNRKIHLHFDKSIVRYLTTTGFDPSLGARPAKRLIDKELSPKIARSLIAGNVQPKEHVVLVLEGSDVVLKKFDPNSNSKGKLKGFVGRFPIKTLHHP